MLPSYVSDRLILKPRLMDHLEHYLAMDLDPEVVKYIRPTPPEEEHRKNLHDYFQRATPPGLGFWSLFEKGEGGKEAAFVGWVLLVPLAGDGPQVEIGYRFVRQAWGKGYATEAASVIRDHAFKCTDLHEICAVTHPENTSSQKVLRKIGLERKEDHFAYEQILPHFVLTREKWLKIKL